MAPPDPAASVPPPDDSAPAICEASDDHHDWATEFTGIDTRADDAPGAPVGQDAPPADNANPDADGDGPSGAPPEASRDTGAEGAGGAPAANGGGPPPAAGDPAKPEEGTWDKMMDWAGIGPEQDRKDQVKGAVDKVWNKSDEDIQAMSAEDKTKLLHDLSANGDPKGMALAVQKRIYDQTPIDPDFQKQDDARSDKVAAALAGDPDLAYAQANWDVLPEADKAAALKKVLTAQSKAMGIPVPELLVDNEMTQNGMTVDGVYADGTLRVNMGPKSMANGFDGALSIVAHENTHHYQEDLLQRLKDGKVNPGDPEYAQAKLFEANNAPGGYVMPGDDLKTYKAQPVERQAWANGNATAEKIKKAL